VITLVDDIYDDIGERWITMQFGNQGKTGKTFFFFFFLFLQLEYKADALNLSQCPKMINLKKTDDTSITLFVFN